MQIIVVYPKGLFGATEDKVMSVDIPKCDDFHVQHYLEMVFRMMNAVDGSDIEKYLKRYQCRSMSVGDMARVQGIWFIVKSVGWQQLDDKDRITELNELVRKKVHE